jgi:hypothetical protein
VKDKSGGEQRGKKRKIQGLFDPPSEGRTPVEPRHIQEAFRRLQQRPNKQRAMCNFTRGLNRTPLKLVSGNHVLRQDFLLTSLSSDRSMASHSDLVGASLPGWLVWRHKSISWLKIGRCWS